MHPDSSRRRVLRRCGAALAIGLAGCLDGGQDGPTTASPTDGTPAATPPTDTEQRPRDEGFPVLWQVSLGASTTRPTVDEETAYVGTDAGGVYALATADGHRRWSAETGAPIRGRPLAAEASVIAVSGEMALGADHRVTAFATDTGRERWQFEPDEWWLDLVGVDDGLLYVATSDDALAGTGETLYAVDVETGEEIWSGEIGDGGRGIVADGTVYVPSFGRLYAYDARSGTRRWATDLPDYNARTIAATAETVCYVGDVDDHRGAVVGLDAATGDVLWTVDDWYATSTTLHDGTLYVGGQRLAALDPATGERLWVRDGGGFVPRVPVREGTIYVGGDGVRAHATDDGIRQWSSSLAGVEGAIPAGATAETLSVDTYRDGEPRNRYKFGVELETGEQAWVFDGETELSSLTQGGQRFLVGGESGSVVALAGE